MDIAAYHEAGHAIACLASNVEIFECWITDKTPTPTGLVRHAEVEASPTAIVILLGGEAAQRRYEPSSLDGDLESAIRTDHSEVQRLLACLGDADDAKEAILAECKRQVAALIEEKWLQVKVLAGALIARRRLTGAEIAAVLAASPVDKSSP